MPPLYTFSTNFTKLGFCATFLINMIFINLTLSYTKHITVTYKRMLVVFAATCIIFSVVEVISEPYSHNFNGGLLYFSLADTNTFSHSFLTLTLWINASCYVAQLGFIAIQFLFRFFTLIHHPFHKSFHGRSQLFWIFYFFMIAITYGLSVYIFLQPDDYSDAYMEAEVWKVYQRRIKNLPRVEAVAYEKGRVRWRIVTFCAIGLIIIGSQYFIILFCALKMQSYMKSHLENFSTRNKKLEMQFLKALTIQFILPTFLITLPIGFVIVVPLLKMEISYQTGVIFALYSLYPPLDSIATMVIVKEYKNCAKRFWKDLKAVLWDSEDSSVKSDNHAIRSTSCSNHMSYP